MPPGGWVVDEKAADTNGTGATLCEGRPQARIERTRVCARAERRMAPAVVASRRREPLPILYRDEQLVAVHKPSGLLVHRTKLDSGERRWLLQMLRAQLRRHVYPVHRLDKGASGVMLFALQREVASALGEMVRGGRLHRTYVAVVRGLTPETGEIDHPLAKILDPAELRGDAAAVGTRPPRPTLTRYRRLASAELPHRVDRYPTSRYSLLQLEPATGRRHQLRRHLHHLSHPIIGDSTYGKGRHNRLFTQLFGCRRLLLACVELRFDHPVSGAPLTVTAPLAGDLAPVLDGLGWTGRLPEAWRPVPLGCDRRLAAQCGPRRRRSTATAPVSPAAS
jgi:tRNA pseudouridine65 synthase